LSQKKEYTKTKVTRCSARNEVTTMVKKLKDTSPLEVETMIMHSSMFTQVVVKEMEARLG
jgi:hypothetical protein